MTSSSVTEVAKFFESVSDSIDYLANYSRSHDYESLACPGTQSHYDAQQFLLIPAILIIIIYSFTIKRKSKYVDKLNGRPGFIYPISVLTHSERLSYAASFGVISALIFKMVFDSRQAIDYDGNSIVQSFISIVSTLIYGINCFPIFASVTLKNALGYGIGTLYVWGFTVAVVIGNVECDMSKTRHFVYSLQNMPHYLSLIYLGVRLPYSFVLEILRWREERTWQREKIKQTFQLLRESYQGRKVRKLLVGVQKNVEPETDTLEGKVNSWCSRMYKEWVYEWDDNFKYSARILTTMWVCFILIYMVTVKLIWTATSFFLWVTDLATYALDGIGWSDQVGDSEVQKLTRTLLKVYYYFFGVLWILLIFCFSLSFILGVLSILYSLTSYRENLNALYRGDHSLVRPITCKTNTGHLIGSIRYAGYQIGYMGWAYVIQSICIIFFIVTACLTLVILFLGFYDWLTETVFFIGPWLIVFVIILVSQYILARFVFLQDYENSLAVDNRRSLNILSYFLFFYNTFVGIGSCLLRLLRSLITAILLIARLDQSILPRKYELKDPGYDRYLGFLHVEAYHSHHCMLVFIDLLKLSQRETNALMTKGPSHTLADTVSKWSKLRGKPANRVQEILVSFLFPKNTSTAGKRKANKVDVISDVLAKIQSNKAKQQEKNQLHYDVSQFSQSAKQNRENWDTIMSNPGHFENTTVQIEEPTKDEGPTDTWDVVRDSVGMKKYRRKQAATFKWLLAYTLLTNPQLRYLRKGFLQKRMLDAEKGIAGEITDS